MFSRKLNPDAKTNHLGVAARDAGCCPEYVVCAYKATITGGSYLGLVFTNSKGEEATVTFANEATDAATLATEIRNAFLLPECDGGLGAFEQEVGCVEIVEDGTDLSVIIKTDIELISIAGEAVEKDCTSVNVCDCRLVLGVDEDLTGLELKLGDNVATLTPAAFATGEGDALGTALETALTAIGATFTGVVVTEDEKNGTFSISIKTTACCSDIEFNCKGLSDCGCEKEYLFEV